MTSRPHWRPSQRSYYLADHLTIDCAVAAQAKLVITDAKSLVTNLRRLRTMEKRCTRCERRESCDQRTYWNQYIDTAIREVAMDWGLI